MLKICCCVYGVVAAQAYCPYLFLASHYKIYNTSPTNYSVVAPIFRKSTRCANTYQRFRRKTCRSLVVPVLSLIISDVTGDAATHIASGPCAPDSTTCADALAVIDRYDLEVSSSIREILSTSNTANGRQTRRCSL